MPITGSDPISVKIQFEFLLVFYMAINCCVTRYKIVTVDEYFDISFFFDKSPAFYCGLPK